MQPFDHKRNGPKIGEGADDQFVNYVKAPDSVYLHSTATTGHRQCQKPVAALMLQGDLPTEMTMLL